MYDHEGLMCKENDHFDPACKDYCELCNYDLHTCAGCGEQMKHDVVACAECTQRIKDEDAIRMMEEYNS